MIEHFLEFWSFRDPNVLWVVTGSVLLSGVAGLVGSFTFLKRRSLVGDTLAHAALPGVTTAFLFAGSRDPFILLAGALMSCSLGWFGVEYLVRNTKLKEDTALAVVLSFFFGIGLFHLAYIQKLPLASQSGLDKILFGQAAALSREDLVTTGVLSVGVLLFVAIFFERLKLVTFDRAFAAGTGIRSTFIEILLSSAVVLAVVVGLNLVGVVLMAAVILTPPAAARYWTNRLSTLVMLAAAFGAGSGLIGANISYLSPRMPTGPWVVVSLTVIFFISMLFAPERGILSHLYRQKGSKERMEEENLLVSFVRLTEGRSVPWLIEEGELVRSRGVTFSHLERTLRRLAKKGYLLRSSKGVELTKEGFEKGQDILRRHRLWELYLTRKANIAPDHVHESAEIVEHLLTPELVAELQMELDRPISDPHGKEIPE